MPVGAHLKEVKFSLHEIDLERLGTTYTSFPMDTLINLEAMKAKEFMAKPFKDLLMSVYGKSMPEQQQVLEDTLDSGRLPGSG